MKGRLQNQINYLLLIRLIELVRDSKRLIENDLSDKDKIILIQAEYNEVFKVVGQDISNFIERNIFCLGQVREQKLPTQFVCFRNEVNAPQFLIGLN